MVNQNETNKQSKLMQKIRIDEQKRIGKALVQFIDENLTDLFILAAIREVAIDLSKGKFASKEQTCPGNCMMCQIQDDEICDPKVAKKFKELCEHSDQQELTFMADHKGDEDDN